MPRENITQKPEKNEQEKINEFYNQVKKGTEYTYDLSTDGTKRINNILSDLKFLLDSDKLPIDSNSIRQALTDCAKIDDKTEFVNKTFEILKPLLDIKFSNPQLFEELQRKHFLLDNKFNSLNELLHYDINDDGWAHIHIAPFETIPAKEKSKLLILFNEGMEKLAEILKNNDNIKGVIAESWIVAEHPKILERYGFKITGEIDEETRQRYYGGGGEQRAIHSAYIDREKFLEKFLDFY